MNEEYGSNQSRLAWILGGLSLGALAMYLADPDRGRQRRALMRDTARNAVSSTGEAFDMARRDIGNRMQGWRTQASHLMARRGEQGLDDVLLKQRVRQQIEHAVSNPQAIEIDAYQGCVTLRGGPVLAYERQNLLDTVRRIEGVSRVEDMLDVREQSTGYTSFRPESGTSLQRAIAPTQLSPAMRTIAMLAGGAVGLYWLTTQRTSKYGTNRGAITISKSIYIDAKPERVYELWSNYEHFPRFMSHVQEVRDLGNGRSHWVVKGPAGVNVEWDAQLTESRRGELLAWQSEPGSTVQNRGWIRFDPEGNGTRVSVHMSYTPPAGAIGQAVASLFASDPKQQMDDDLMRMKTFIETGQAPRDAAQPVPPSVSTLH